MLDLTLNYLSLTHCHPDGKMPPPGDLLPQRGGFIAGFRTVATFELGGVVVGCCRGNRQEAECAAAAAEDRVLRR